MVAIPNHSKVEEPRSPVAAGEAARCILFDGSMVEGVVVGVTPTYVSVDVYGDELRFEHGDVSPVLHEMHDFELRAKIVNDRFHAQLGYLNPINQANAIAATEAVPA